jgi:peroxiredoxin
LEGRLKEGKGEFFLKKGFSSFGFLFLIVLLPGFLGCGNKSESGYKPGGLVAGDKAADFALMDSNGHVMRLSDVQAGWYLVLILYRGYWCNVCLNQLLSLKNDFPKFQDLHATIAAISVDPVEDSAAFNRQWRFPFPLLSDTQLRVIDAYGTRHPNGHNGNDISRPAVIIIDPQKIVRSKYVGKDPSDRPANDEILFQIQQIQQKTARK